MNKRTGFLLTAALISLVSCTNTPDQTDISTDFPVAKSSSVERLTETIEPAIIKEQAASNNQFAVKMYKLLSDADKNLFFSPYSITSALAMTAAGAVDSTKTQMHTALQTTLKDIEFDKAMNAIDLSLMSATDIENGVTLNVVNSTWMQVGWDFKFNYLDHLSRYYGAGVNMLDFVKKPDESRLIINEWVSEQTNHKIENLLPDGSVTDATVLVLTNAIYFLADWDMAFKPELTKNATFYTIDKSQIQVPSMYFVEPGKKVVASYVRKPAVRALDLPYIGKRLSMTILLPDLDSFTVFESRFTPELLEDIVTSLDTQEIPVSLPKFKFTFGSASIRDALQKLGMKDAFIMGRADFSGIDGKKELYVDDVYHKAFIEVNEKGTEAAAATGVVMSTTSINPDIKEFIVNRPFMFVIRDNVTGAILFMGKIMNPLLTQ